MSYDRRADPWCGGGWTGRGFMTRRSGGAGDILVVNPAQTDRQTDGRTDGYTRACKGVRHLIDNWDVFDGTAS